MSASEPIITFVTGSGKPLCFRHAVKGVVEDDIEIRCLIDTDEEPDNTYVGRCWVCQPALRDAFNRQRDYVFAHLPENQRGKR